MEVLLFSGGIESTCLAYMRRPQICLTVDYGQRCAEGEIRAAQNISSFFNLEHHVLKVDLSSLGSGEMSDENAVSIAPIPEFWPFRNQMLVTIGAMRFAASKEVCCV